MIVEVSLGENTFPAVRVRRTPVVVSMVERSELESAPEATNRLALI